jgi:hypothetical protein
LSHAAGGSDLCWRQGRIGSWAKILASTGGWHGDSGEQESASDRERESTDDRSCVWKSRGAAEIVRGWERKDSVVSGRRGIEKKALGLRAGAYATIGSGLSWAHAAKHW